MDKNTCEFFTRRVNITEMVNLKRKSHSYLISFLVVLVFHLIVLFVFKRDTRHQFTISAPPHRHQLNKIDFITKEDLTRIKRVGTDIGKKNLDQPDFLKNNKPTMLKPRANISPTPAHTEATKAPSGGEVLTQPIGKIRPSSHSEKYSENKVIAPSTSHEIVKQDTLRNLSFNKSGIAAQKISNFEIRYERPEGVSEDELNSDEKAFYSFYKRSYASYVSKLYATYDEIAISRPKIHRDFENKHLLVGRIDYDKDGNIIMVKILKSSESDDVHYFFEETLKKLVLPNPPKIFLKMKKEFSIYYQVQIN